MARRPDRQTGFHECFDCFAAARPTVLRAHPEPPFGFRGTTPELAPFRAAAGRFVPRRSTREQGKGSRKIRLHEISIAFREYLKKTANPPRLSALRLVSRSAKIFGRPKPCGFPHGVL